MGKKPTNENETIKEGLERFLEQELEGFSAGNSSNEPSGETKSEEIQMIGLAHSSESKENMGDRIKESNDSIHRDIPQKQATNTRNKNQNNPHSTGKAKGKTAQKKDRMNMSGGKKKKHEDKKKNSRLKKVLIILAVMLLLGMGLLYLLIGSVYGKMEYKSLDGYTAKPMKEDGITNVLLIGNDSRSKDNKGRSDAMILLSISDKTKTITMTSFLRDMYVDIPGHKSNRLNAAYSYGGPELLMETIEQNFGIKIHRYATVNFQAFANLVDAVNGVDLELSNEEVKYVNGYLVEYNILEERPEGTDYLDEGASGMIHLNGPQALAYTRNRYLGTDFGRTERQRKVLSAIMQKAPAALATNSKELINGLFPYLTTNLTQGECFRLSLNATKFLSYEQVQLVIPSEGTYKNASIRGMSVLEVDFDANKKILNEALSGEK